MLRMKRQHKHHFSQSCTDILQVICLAFVTIKWNRLLITVLIINVNLRETLSKPNHFKVQIQKLGSFSVVVLTDCNRSLLGAPVDADTSNFPKLFLNIHVHQYFHRQKTLLKHMHKRHTHAAERCVKVKVLKQPTTSDLCTVKPQRQKT